MRRLSWILALLCGVCVVAATDPGTRGPFAVAKRTESVPVRGGATRVTDIYFPSANGGTSVDPAAGRLPVVVFGHGFSRNKDRYDLGEHMASRGYAVLQTNYDCSLFGCNHSANADEMSDVISWILARDADPSSLFFGRIATERVGTSGHSAGGLQALVCTSRDPRVKASAPMDAVDNNGLGVGSLPGVRKPIAISYSEPSSCNAGGSSPNLYAAANPQKRGVKIVSANHCDPEKDNDFLGCALTCGTWNAARHQAYLRYVTGWFEYYLRCDPSYFEWVWGGRVQNDLGGGVVTYDASVAPPPPTGVTAERGAASIAIRRDPPSQCAGVDAWRVGRSPTAGGPYDLVADGLAPSVSTWTDANVEPGMTYYYVARDVFSDFRGAAESPDSNQASASIPSSPGEASRAGSEMLAARGTGNAVEIWFSPASCATDHVAVWGSAPGPILGQVTWSGQACALGATGQATFDPGLPAPGWLLYFVVVGNDGVYEGSYGRASSRAERPEAAGLPGCDYPQRLEGACP